MMPWLDWCSHLHFTFLYVLGYCILSVDQYFMDRILTKYGLLYLCCGTMLLCLRLPSLLYYKPETWLWCPENNAMFLRMIDGFGEWMFMIGLYAITKSIYSKEIKIISFLSKLAMPFYMLHLAVLHNVSSYFKKSLSPDKLYPELEFATTLTMTTLLTLLLSYLVSKSPNSVRYCFGLPSNIKETGKISFLHRFSPILFLITIRIIGCLAVKNKFLYS